jgi:transcriptional regulator with XRE-family HTH domain
LTFSTRGHIFCGVKKKLPPITKKDAGYFMRVWRAERDLSQRQAGRCFNMKPSFWSLVENGKRFLSPRLAKILAEATGQPIEVFLNMGGQ